MRSKHSILIISGLFLHTVVFSQWVKSAGGTSADFARSIAVDGSGNVYVAGGYNGTADFDPSSGTTNLTPAGDTDIFFAKYNSSGELTWAKSLGGTSADEVYSIVMDPHL